ncbi:MAG: DUF6497 family protein [Paracoccus sp. (in: a-proteobacteria)]|uniref:DUF6497 family protein n=1 Tax=Paracoccus sp. TaxID=267 RepID=UPI0026DECB8A|nr:DUF6497 family protein [Paracoccus sp. (in: a-proteobacteria)]MDO5622672.1 DUF6497 family protein [Paracoccus sp. (in: a-proteobacteria)]
MRLVPALAPIFACLTLAAPVAAWAEDATPPPLPVPSGMLTYWQDVVHTAPGAYGLTYRFRFVSPNLPKLIPPPVLPPIDEAQVAVLDDPMSWLTGFADAQLVPEDQDMPSLLAPDLTATGPLAVTAQGAQPLADGPTVEALEQVQADMLWLCLNYALPRLAEEGPRPVQIIISLADRVNLFGAANPEMVQVFEAYDLPADTNTCQPETAI